MDHVAGPLHILLAEKEGRIWFNIICLQIYQFERTTWWCLSVLKFVLESLMKFVLEFAIKYVMKYVMLRKYYTNHGLLKFALGPPLGGRADGNFGRP